MPLVANATSDAAEPPRAAAPTREKRAVLYGEGLERDPRIAHIVERERFLVSVILPRLRTFGDARREWTRRSFTWSVMRNVAVVLTLHLAGCLTCASGLASTVCGMKEGDASDASEWVLSYSQFGAPLINTLAVLMLSFYANICMTLYKDGYLASQRLKESIFDLTSIVAGTIASRHHEVRMEFWRCINLYHVCTYVLADKARGTYSLDHFLLPVATAFGEWDAEEGTNGMLTADVRRIIAADEDADPVAAMGAPRAPKLGTRTVLSTHGVKAPTLDHEVADLKQERRRQQASAKGGSRSMSFRRRAAASAMAAAMRSQPSRTRGRIVHQQLTSLANSRGDTASTVAALRAALGVRLYQLVDLVIEAKLSRAAWPAWNAQVLKLRTNAEALQQLSLYCLPRIYPVAVRFLVAATVLTDTWLLAMHAARMLRLADADDGWTAHAYFGAAVDVFLNVLLAWCLTVFVDAVADMQTPFGSECFDMPGLSYVSAAAELSLRIMRGGHESGKAHSQPINELFRVLTGDAALDREKLGGLPVGAPRPDPIDDEDQDGTDE